MTSILLDVTQSGAPKALQATPNLHEEPLRNGNWLMTSGTVILTHYNKVILWPGINLSTRQSSLLNRCSGGRLPANSMLPRTAGRIFVEDGQDLDYTIFPDDPLHSVTLEFWDDGNNLVFSQSGLDTMLGTFVPSENQIFFCSESYAS